MLLVYPRFFFDQFGTTAIEYSLIAAGVAVAVLSAINALGNAVSVNLFGLVAGSFP